MRIHNAEIADMFFRLADLLEIEGENPFRVLAYRNAARAINGLAKDLAQLVEEDVKLTDIPGIGRGMDEKIHIILKTHQLPQLQEVEARTPPILSKLMKIESLGPKRIALLYKKLNIRSLQDLTQAIQEGKLQNLHGFGDKTIKKIQEGLQHLSEEPPKYLLSKVTTIAEGVLNYLRKCPLVIRVDIGGSYRRKKEVVADLDIVATAKSGEKVIDYFVKYDEVSTILSQGTTRSTVKLHSNIQVDLRVIPEKCYGAALLYFTGSKPHNIAIRKIALKKKWKVNEYGLFRGNRCLASKTEKDIYEKLGLEYIEPELREDRGEIKAARENKLPRLITLKDIRGDLHCHTTETDGRDTLERMVQGARDKGYEYLAITDHTPRLAMMRFSQKDLIKQMKRIDQLNARNPGIVILKSAEVDILEDGSLDLPDSILQDLDLTICSIHSYFNLTPNKQTSRILRAMDNPYFTILGHATGRLINKRKPYLLDLEKIFKAAKERSIVIELDSQPDRLDIDDINCKMAKEMGLKIAISSDAHGIEDFDFMQFGINQARRGWLEKKDVINTLSLNNLLKFLKKK